MLSGPVIITVAFLYLCLLFAIAYYGDKRADQGRSLIANPSIYALSIAVYCTSWTFYGSVGRAASSGVDFLPIYLGPTLTFIVGWFVIRKIIRISKVNRTTSIADFVASRYGKSFQLGGLVTVIAVVGILPYISLQLKAISTSFSLLLHYPEIVVPTRSASAFFLQDTAFYVALFMAVFAILFGTRHIDASERHEGMVAAIAFELVVKLIAFLAVGLFVTFGLYGGLGDIFARAEASAALSRLFTIDGVAQHTSWITLTLLAMGAIVVLPRQFQVMVVENVDERHLKKAMWLFPLYLLLINIFVLPIAFAGLLTFPQGGVDADTFVLTIPMQQQQPLIALIAFIGGLSAATGMIIVETVALATMVCNDLVMPLLLRVGRLHRSERRDLAGILLGHSPHHHHSRRAARLCLCAPDRRILRAGDDRPRLVRGGDAVRAGDRRRHLLERRHQGGRGRRADRRLPAVDLYAAAAVLRALGLDRRELSSSIGPFGLAALKPYALFGLAGLDPIAHATIWTMLVNVGLFVGVSLLTSQSIIERSQAVQFVDIFKRVGGSRAGLAQPRDDRRPAATARPLHRGGARECGSCASRARARAAPARPGSGRFRGRLLCGAAACRGDRRGVRPHHGRVGVARGDARHRRGRADPRRGLAARRLFAPARAEIARARGGDRRTCAPPTSACRSSTG